MQTEGQRDFWRLIAGGVLPPLGIYLQLGIGSVFYWNILLTLLCWIPGVIHAAWVIMRRDDGGDVVEGGGQRFAALLFSYFVPPVGVFLVHGFSAKLGINLLLTLLGYLPGIVHAVWVVATDLDDVDA